MTKSLAGAQMIWKPLLWIAHHFLSFTILGAFGILIWVRNRRPAKECDLGRIEFSASPISLGALAFIAVYSFYLTIDLFAHSHGRPLDLVQAALVGLIALLFLGGLPGTLIVMPDGLNQVYWLRRSKRIRWQDIVEINTGKPGSKNPAVTIIGANGTKIIHSNEMADRSRLLLELKKYCGENLPADFPRKPITR